jgi:hypothetical protein
MPADFVLSRWTIPPGSMFRKGLPLIAALGLVVAGPPGARADLCFHYQKSGGGTLVAKGAKLPAPNTCETLPLFETDGGRGGAAGTKGLEGAATGSICTDVAGATVIFHYTYDGCLGPASYFESATCRLQLQNGNLPTTFGSCRGTANQSGFVDDSAILQSCDNVQVPNDTAALCVIRPGLSHKLDQR